MARVTQKLVAVLHMRRTKTLIGEVRRHWGRECGASVTERAPRRMRQWPVVADSVLPARNTRRESEMGTPKSPQKV
jgi:hypothetical protein